MMAFMCFLEAVALMIAVGLSWVLFAVVAFTPFFALGWGIDFAIRRCIGATVAKRVGAGALILCGLVLIFIAYHAAHRTVCTVGFKQAYKSAMGPH